MTYLEALNLANHASTYQLAVNEGEGVLISDVKDWLYDLCLWTIQIKDEMSKQLAEDGVLDAGIAKCLFIIERAEKDLDNWFTNALCS